jgi:hypothetical protein
VLAEQVLVVDTDARHWINLLSLFGKADQPPAWLICILDGDQCVKAIHTRKGPLWGFAFPGREHLDAAAEKAEADCVLCLPRGGLQEIFYHAQARVKAFDDYVKQMLDLIAGAREALDRLAVWYPQKPFELTLPSYDQMQLRLNKLWPDGTTIGLFVFEHTRPFTSLILGKDGGHLSLITSLDALGMANESLDFRANFQTYGELIASRFAPLHAALFIELASFRELRAGPRPLTYLRLAERRGRALIYPKPRKLRLLLWLARVFKGL